MLFAGSDMAALTRRRIPAAPDEAFHHLVTDMLREWQRQHPDHPTVVTVVDQQAPRSYQIRDLLQRGGLPFAFHTADSPGGEALLREIGRPGSIRSLSERTATVDGRRMRLPASRWYG